MSKFEIGKSQPKVKKKLSLYRHSKPPSLQIADVRDKRGNFATFFLWFMEIPNVD